MRCLMTAMASIAAGVILAGGSVRAEDIRSVRAIEFRGLTLLSKYDIIRGTRLKASGEGIVIDVDSLENSLAGNPFVASHRVKESGGRLVVTVEERTPEWIVTAPERRGRVMCEVDAGGRIISRNDPHTAKVPVLHLGDTDLSSPGVPAEVRWVMDLLARVKASDPLTYGELSEIYIGGGRLRIYARGRRTEFIVRPVIGDFVALRHLIGICDHAKRHPGKVILGDHAAIIR
ncbi:MAG: hypothetical protein JW838_03000 [Spirochaetes bacterium]|nr:hypothetical protein [Spirochaetota bacterium]